MSPVAIVTASDSGIGKATAVLLASRGFDLGVTWRSDEGGAKGIAEEIAAYGRRAEVRRMDLTDLPAAADGVDDLAEALGGVNVFVNNAATGSHASVLDMTLEEWQEPIDVHLLAHAITVNSVAPGEIPTPCREPRTCVHGGRSGADRHPVRTAGRRLQDRRSDRLSRRPRGRARDRASMWSTGACCSWQRYATKSEALSDGSRRAHVTLVGKWGQC